MVDYVAAVREFMEKNDQYIRNYPGAISSGVALLRLRLMAEELGEVSCAMHENDLTKIADGLADLVYVVVGTAIAYGIPFNEVFTEVHRSNMTKPKLDENQKGGKVKKEGFEPPQIALVIDQAKESYFKKMNLRES